MTIGLKLSGRAPRRGLALRPMGPAELSHAIETWLRSVAPGVVRSVRRIDEPAGVVLRTSIHPAAADVETG